MAGEAFFGHGSDDEARGIPADLVPYLEAADAPDEGADQAEEPNAAADDSARDAALRALVENSLLVGPDPTILAEITGDFDEAFADDADADAADDADWSDDADSAPGADDSARASRTASGARSNATSPHDAALAAAADQVQLDAQVRRIYESIVERAPEHDIDPTLDRVKTVLDILGDPQNAYPSVHVTGTNGKTSTARMIDAVLTAFGMKVGRFTSPHLIDVRERISLEGHPISREGFIAAWKDVEPYIRMVDERSQEQGGPRLSFFEVFTVMAFAAFADYPVDAAVVEVGMGGTWDSTNVIGAGVSVITPIGVDHARWLGSTVEQIAR